MWNSGKKFNEITKFMAGHDKYRRNQIFLPLSSAHKMCEEAGITVEVEV
jgi:hypothetical protein